MRSMTMLASRGWPLLISMLALGVALGRSLHLGQQIQHLLEAFVRDGELAVAVEQLTLMAEHPSQEAAAVLLTLLTWLCFVQTRFLGSWLPVRS